MKEVIKYEAEDGSIHDTEDECKHHEFRKHMEQRIYDELRYADAEDIFQWIIDNLEEFK